MSSLVTFSHRLSPGRQQRQRRHRLALRAGRDDAHLPRRQVGDVLDVDERRVGDVQQPEVAGQPHVLASPTDRAWRPPGRTRSRRRRSAGCGGCGWRSDAVMMRRPSCWRKRLTAPRPTSRSLGACPASSAFVESHSSRRTPSLDGDRADAGQVGAAAVDRGQVELEVTRVQDHALRRVERGRERVGHRVGDRDELDVERTRSCGARRRRPG